MVTREALIAEDQVAVRGPPDNREVPAEGVFHGAVVQEGFHAGDSVPALPRRAEQARRSTNCIYIDILIYYRE